MMYSSAVYRTANAIGKGNAAQDLLVKQLLDSSLPKHAKWAAAFCNDASSFRNTLESTHSYSDMATCSTPNEAAINRWNEQLFIKYDNIVAMKTH